jgi:hypothetical protein
VGKEHGRLEIRECRVTSDPQDLASVDPDHEWDGLQRAGVIESVRDRGDPAMTSLRSFSSSLKPAAQEMLACIRNHWGVENSLHGSKNLIVRDLRWYVEKKVDFIDACNAAWMEPRTMISIYTFDRKHFARLEGLHVLVPGE